MKSNNTDIILTIGIPTFNGAEYLAEALDSIRTQLNSANSHIEIIVSDNASTDRTQELVREYNQTYNNIVTYYRNEENLGPDKNVVLIFKKAKGKYVWMMSDDNALEEDSISYLLNILSKHSDLAVVFARYRYFDAQLSNCLTDDISGNLIDELCLNGDMFFQKSRFLCGSMSSLIIKTSFWNDVNAKRFRDSRWIHFETIIHGLIDKTAYIIRQKPMVKERSICRWGDDGTFTLFIGLSLVEIFKQMKSLGYSKETYSLGINMMRHGNLRAILRANSKGLKNKFVAAKKMISCYGSYISFWFLDLPVLFTPNIFSKFIAYIYKTTAAKPPR